MKAAEQLAALPTTPGIYQFLDSKGHILYVGKAKSLRPRVRSYFRVLSSEGLRRGHARWYKNEGARNPKPKVPDTLPLEKLLTANYQLQPNKDLDPAKQEMVAKIADLKTISTDSEIEALILEANLIRKLQPPYNVLLRDDKYYLFIKITTREKYPRVFPTRRLKKDHARYFGPYSSAASVRRTLELLRRVFPHRQEKDSPRDKIFPHPLFNKNKNYPEQTTRANPKNYSLPTTHYQLNIANIIKFLQGHRTAIINTLKQGMKESARARQYERAAIFRDQLRAIEHLEGHQKVYLPSQESFDVVSLARHKSTSAANIFAIRQGQLLNKNTFLLKHRARTNDRDVLRQFILQYYRVAQDTPRLILLPNQLADADAIARWINPIKPPAFFIPRRGKKKQLINMGQLNAKQLLIQESAQFISAGQTQQALKELAKAIHAKSKLERIETYDISNIQGKLATGSMVVFTHGQPDKSQYRKFRITTKDTPDDFHMMREILTRRFKNHQSDWPQPDLIIIDGGKGQLTAAKQILDKRNLHTPIMALAKKEEEIFIPGQSASIKLPFDSPALFLIQQMRDEAHRFTVTYHRLLRGQKQTRSLLDEVPGIGPATKKKLLNHFGSLKAIRTAEKEKLAQLIGPSKTQTLRDYL